MLFCIQFSPYSRSNPELNVGVIFRVENRGQLPGQVSDLDPGSIEVVCWGRMSSPDSELGRVSDRSLGFGVGVKSQFRSRVSNWVSGSDPSSKVKFQVGSRGRVSGRSLGRISVWKLGPAWNVGPNPSSAIGTWFKYQVSIQVSHLGSGSGVDIEVRFGSISNVRSRVGSQDQVLNQVLGSCLRLGVGVWIES